mgnify:CR=1 FL=1
MKKNKIKKTLYFIFIVILCKDSKKILKIGNFVSKSVNKLF